jgi:hypothetical protein
LFPLVYDELRKLAASKLAQEQPGQTLQATALVHEAYLRLAGAEPGPWGTAAITSSPPRPRRCGECWSSPPAASGGSSTAAAAPASPSWRTSPAPARPERLLALDEALDRLAAANTRAAELVKLRCFAGFSNARAAEILGISPRKADQVWAYARAWLWEEIGDDEGA